jgi:CPA1 family monovalent cation:H+ antiporter
MPQRVVDLLEGESLLNDATGLLALQFGVEMVVQGTTPTVTRGLLEFAWLTIGGVLVGLAIGWAVTWLERWVDDGPVEIALSLLVPYAAYLAGDAVKASGVIAVVACGLLVS